MKRRAAVLLSSLLQIQDIESYRCESMIRWGFGTRIRSESSPAGPTWNPTFESPRRGVPALVSLIGRLLERGPERFSFSPTQKETENQKMHLMALEVYVLMVA